MSTTTSLKLRAGRIMALATLVAILVLSAATAQACPRQIPHDASSAQAPRGATTSQGSDCLAAAGQTVLDTAVRQAPHPTAITLLATDSTQPLRPALPAVSQAVHAPAAARPQVKAVLRI